MMKLVFLVLIYFAGFATAIYMTTPTTASAGQCEVQADSGPVISPEAAQKINVNMRKCVYVGKEAAIGASEYIKSKLKEGKFKD